MGFALPHIVAVCTLMRRTLLGESHLAAPKPHLNRT